MNEELIQAITSLISQGGWMAVAIYGMSLVATVLKYVIGFGFFFFGIKNIARAIEKTWGNKNVS